MSNILEFPAGEDDRATRTQQIELVRRMLRFPNLPGSRSMGAGCYRLAPLRIHGWRMWKPCCCRIRTFGTRAYMTSFRT